MDEVRRTVGVEMTGDLLAGLAEQAAGLTRGVAAFPLDDLKTVEPPLRSVAGPLPRPTPPEGTP